MKKLSSFLLKITHWKTEVTIEIPPKSIVCVAPHTSNWDFIIGKLFAWKVGFKAGFLMKKSWFFFPIGNLLRAMDGVPVDRSKVGSTVEQMIEKLKNGETSHLAITPEGTRKPNRKWKLGFYFIAKGANVPIMLTYIDYKKREIAIKKIIQPSDNESADLKEIYDYYRNVSPKFADRFLIPKI